MFETGRLLRHAPETLRHDRWLQATRRYAIGCGLAAAGLTLLFGGASGTGLVLAALCIGFFCAAAVGFAVLAARHVSLALARRMREAIEHAVATGGTPVLTNNGWEAFNGLAIGIRALLAPRDARIAALQAEVAHFRQLAEDTPGIEWVLDTESRLQWSSPATEVLTGFGFAEGRAISDPAELWLFPKDRPLMRDRIAQALRGEGSDNTELRLLRKGGGHFWCACRWTPLYDGKQVVGLRFSALDIQPRKDAEFKLLETVAALRRAQALKEHYLSRSNDERIRLAALLDLLDLGILFVDRDRRVVYINQPCVELWQLGERDAVVGMRDETLLSRTDALRIDNETYLRHVNEVITEQREQAEYIIHLKDGRVVRERSSVVLSADAGQAIGRIWIYENITEALRTQQHLTRLAERDPLTGLYNRRRFHEDLDRLLASAGRHDEGVGLMLFDLDGFKEINERYGRQAGDEVLQAAARAIGSVVRRDEFLYRLGSDEFALLLPGPDETGMQQLAGRLQERTAALGFDFYASPGLLSLSLGLARSPEHGTDAYSLTHAADQALHRAKHEGRACWRQATRLPPGSPTLPGFLSSSDETLQ